MQKSALSYYYLILHNKTSPVNFKFNFIEHRNESLPRKHHEKAGTNYFIQYVYTTDYTPEIPDVLYRSV